MSNGVFENNVKLNASYGASLLNALRQAVMNEVPVVRPIAVQLGSNANILSAGSFIEEDTSEFIANILGLVFQATESCTDDLIIGQYQVKDVLKDSDLAKCDDLLVSNTCGEEILHVFSEVEITVYYRVGVGAYSREQNSDFLEEHKIGLDGLAVLNSRHSPVEFFTVEESEEDSTIHNFKLTMKCLQGYNAEHIIGIATDSLSAALDKFY